MILLDCLAWIPHILRLRPTIRRDDDIPDDMIIEILSRLPADCVLKCQRVCKKWHALTSTQSFVELHLKRGGAASALHSIFVHRIGNTYTPNETEIHLCDDGNAHGFHLWRDKSIKQLSTSWFYKIAYKFGPTVCSSCDGLLVLRQSVQDERHVFVLNPVVKELVCMRAPFRILPPCGIYRDPRTLEYKLLLYSTDNFVQFSYYIVSLKTMTMKKLKFSSSWHNRRILACMIPLKESLHWLVENSGFDGCKYAIMVFNTKTEHMQVLPHPGDKSICRHRDIELVERRGELWAFQVFVGEIQVFVLEDYKNWRWNTRDRVSLDWSTWLYPFVYEIEASIYDPRSIRILGIRNGVELLVCWSYRGLFWYNIKDKIVFRAFIFDVDDIGTLFPSPIGSCAYTKTLVRIAPDEAQDTHILCYNAN